MGGAKMHRRMTKRTTSKALWEAGAKFTRSPGEVFPTDHSTRNASCRRSEFVEDRRSRSHRSWKIFTFARRSFILITSAFRSESFMLAASARTAISKTINH